jgi:hypothetical protein
MWRASFFASLHPAFKAPWSTLSMREKRVSDQEICTRGTLHFSSSGSILCIDKWLLVWPWCPISHISWRFEGRPNRWSVKKHDAVILFLPERSAIQRLTHCFAKQTPHMTIKAVCRYEMLGANSISTLAIFKSLLLAILHSLVYCCFYRWSSTHVLTHAPLLHRNWRTSYWMSYTDPMLVMFH